MKTVDVTAHQSDFIERAVASGDFQDASDVVRAAIRLLESQQREEAEKLERLRQLVQVGIEDIERGDFIDVKREQIDDFITSLAEHSRKLVER